MTKGEFKEQLQEDLECSKSRIDNMSKYELMDAKLKYEGIIGYTYSILEWVEAIWGIKLPM